MSNSIRFIKSNRGKHDQIIFENNVYWHNKTYPSQAIIELIKQEYKCHSISFDEFFEKMCNQVLDPFIFNTKFLSNKLLKNYKNICFI